MQGPRISGSPTFFLKRVPLEYSFLVNWGIWNEYELRHQRELAPMVRALSGRRILITGASRGLGRSLAEQTARAGAALALVARSAEPLHQLADLLAAQGGNVVAIPADVTSDEDRRRVLATTAERLGGLDVLVNNAGIASFGHFSSSSEEVLRQIMEVNFFAPAELIRLAVPLLRWGQQPAIVNIASMCGRRALPAWSEYSASKFALCALTEALRGEMVRFHIDVLLVLPGLTHTTMGSHLLRNEGRMKIDFRDGMSVDLVAAKVLQALQHNRTETVIGREAWWLLLSSCWLPRFVDRLMARRVKQLYA
jgi:short-subunit dehydrogenase